MRLATGVLVALHYQQKVAKLRYRNATIAHMTNRLTIETAKLIVTIGNSFICLLTSTSLHPTSP